MKRSKNLKRILIQAFSVLIALISFKILCNYSKEKLFIMSDGNTLNTAPFYDRKSDMLTLEEKMFPDFRNCSTKTLISKYVQKGNYRVLQNYIKATETFVCNESITYATIGETGFLHNLIELASRWQGPISVAVYAPGKSFANTLEAIFYLRECRQNDVKKFVTFHIFFDFVHVPDKVPSPMELLLHNVNCSRNLADVDYWNSFRHMNGLPFPVNVARNIAKSNLATYFYFASDIELYPSINLIPGFLGLLTKPDCSKSPRRRVYVLPVFEMQENIVPPRSKTGLVALIQEKKAFLFHQNICRKCHEIPDYEQWLQAPINSGLSVFTVGIRKFQFAKWEPIFIGTEREPDFDERLSLEGLRNKMVQNYIMCLMGYEYHVLDNAFIIHKPGLKQRDKKVMTSPGVKKQKKLITTKIKEECDKLYGTDEQCKISI